MDTHLSRSLCPEMPSHWRNIGSGKGAEPLTINLICCLYSLIPKSVNQQHTLTLFFKVLRIYSAILGSSLNTRSYSSISIEYMVGTPINRVILRSSGREFTPKRYDLR